MRRNGSSIIERIITIERLNWKYVVMEQGQTCNFVNQHYI